MSSIQLADVDDYINPSQACINPLFTSTKTNKDNASSKEEEKQTNTQLQQQILQTKRRKKRNPLIYNNTGINNSKDGNLINTSNGNSTVLLENEIKKKDEKIKDRPTIILKHDNYLIKNESITKSTNTETDTDNTKSTISIADCLACSGCITSSEAILITTLHSIDTLKKNCFTTISSSKKTKNNNIHSKRIVFTISPIVIADLLRVLHPNNNDNHDNNKVMIQMTYQRLTSFLYNHFHASVVLDGMIPQRLSLLQSAIEFCKRYQFWNNNNNDKDDSNVITSNNSNGNGNVNDSQIIIDLDTPSIALSATETRYLKEIYGKTQGIEIKHEAGIDTRLSFLQSSLSSTKTALPSLSTGTLSTKSKHVLPMLASSCPGFVCYVEKTTPNVIANLCTVKSPMAIAGSIFKHNLLLPSASSSNNNNNVNVLIHEKQNNMNKKQGGKEENDKGDMNTYHVAIMPCHDKKLEAERKDFAWERFVEQEKYFVSDVDLVITTNELFTVLMESAIDEHTSKDNGSSHDKSRDNAGEEKLKVLREYFANLPLAPMGNLVDLNNNCNGLFVSTMNIIETSNKCDNKVPIDGEDDVDLSMKGSGSYAEFIFRFSSLALFGYHIPPTVSLPWRAVTRRGPVSKRSQRSFSDFNEVSLFQHSDGTYSCQSMKANGDLHEKEVLKFATSYGFKNIQLLLQQIRNNDVSNYHYVETMACPSGCVNGGGQIKSESSAYNNSSDDLLGSIKRKEKPSEKHDRVRRAKHFVLDMIACDEDSSTKNSIVRENLKSHLHTRYHVVPKLELTTGSTAGVKLDDTKW